MQPRFSLFLSFALGVNAAYNLAATVPWAPTAPSSVDQSIAYQGVYYLSDRTNKLVHFVNLTTNTEITSVNAGFITTTVNGSLVSGKSGPAGLVLLANRNEIWAGDGNGTIHVIDMATMKPIANISTGASTRADEFAYNPMTGIVVATAANEVPPFVSVVNATSRTVIGKIVYDNATGLEQPAYNPLDSTLWISVPSTGANPGGEISQISTTGGNYSVIKTYPVPDCITAGITFGASNNLFISCAVDQLKEFNLTQSYMMDITTGKITANVSGVSGVDQVTYSPKTGYFYAAAYLQMNGSNPNPNIAVIAANGTVLQRIPADNVTAHAVAVDNSTGNVIFPIKAKGIQIWSMTANATNTSSNGSSATSSGSVASSTGGAATMAATSMGWVVMVFAAAWML